MCPKTPQVCRWLPHEISPGRQHTLLPPWVWLRLTLVSLHSLRECLAYWDEGRQLPGLHQ